MTTEEKIRELAKNGGVEELLKMRNELVSEEDHKRSSQVIKRINAFSSPDVTNFESSEELRKWLDENGYESVETDGRVFEMTLRHGVLNGEISNETLMLDNFSKMVGA